MRLAVINAARISFPLGGFGEGGVSGDAMRRQVVLRCRAGVRAVHTFPLPPPVLDTDQSTTESHIEVTTPLLSSCSSCCLATQHSPHPRTPSRESRRAKPVWVHCCAAYKGQHAQPNASTSHGLANRRSQPSRTQAKSVSHNCRAVFDKGRLQRRRKGCYGTGCSIPQVFGALLPRTLARCLLGEALLQRAGAVEHKGPRSGVRIHTEVAKPLQLEPATRQPKDCLAGMEAHTHACC